jgi:hypothetical protein
VTRILTASFAPAKDISFCYGVSVQLLTGSDKQNYHVVTLQPQYGHWQAGAVEINQWREIPIMDKYTFTVAVPKVDGATEAMVKEYIIEAIESHSGGCDPEHPLYGAFRGGQVTCVRTVKQKHD